MILESKKQDNGWTATFYTVGDMILEVHAECLKVVQEGTAG
jgi:hypothetical protein